MPPSARIVWKTQEGRDVWQPKIRRASHVYNQLERLTVMDGVRSCTTFHASPERIEDELRGLSRDGLCFLPIRKVGSYSGFAHSHPPVIEGQPWGYYGVISRNGT